MTAPISLPFTLADVALIDGKTAAAAGSISISLWHDLVRKGKAPKPAIKEPRCTRWRAVDVAAYWRERIAIAAASTMAAEAMTARAKHASDRARTPEAVAKGIATKRANIARRKGQPAQVGA